MHYNNYRGGRKKREVEKLLVTPTITLIIIYASYSIIFPSPQLLGFQNIASIHY